MLRRCVRVVTLELHSSLQTGAQQSIGPVLPNTETPTAMKSYVTGIYTNVWNAVGLKTVFAF